MAITPYLYYEDVEAALTFLAKAFGFRKSGPQIRGADGRIKHAAMQLGKDLVMMGRPPAGYRNPKRLGQATQSLLINVPDVDKHFERATKAGATVLEPPGDTPFGQRRWRDRPRRSRVVLCSTGTPPKAETQTQQPNKGLKWPARLASLARRASASYAKASP